MPHDSRSRLPAAREAPSRLVVPAALLLRTVEGLRARSAAWRESACVWAGSRSGHVTGVVFHHELGDDRASALSLELPESGKFALYTQLAARSETLLALLHTHPESWVGLSAVDQRNQVSSRIDFWSIVLPHYAAGNWRTDEVGFHVRCDRGWRQLDQPEVQRRFRVDPQS
jgi:proteasome lid subunit RPN8/RPN11